MMNKYEVEFSYITFDEHDDIHDGGPMQFTIEADCKDCAIEKACRP